MGDEAAPVDLGGLFAAKKTAKRQKISLAPDETEQSATASVVTSSSPALPVQTSKLDYAYTSADTPAVSPATFATATNEYDTELDRDHKARRQETLERSRRLADTQQLDTVYHGLKGYQQFLMQGDTARANAASDKNRVAGPVRAVSNLRVTCRFDYKPDLCKDYNETGFCGFGDSCIFLHDRTEHKSSYQLEQEWEAEQKRKKLEDEHRDELIKTGEEKSPVPVECLVCRQAFTRPVKTLCGHYFCEKCVLRKNKCPQCNAALLGSFRPAKELTKTAAGATRAVSDE